MLSEITENVLAASFTGDSFFTVVGGIWVLVVDSTSLNGPTSFDMIGGGDVNLRLTLGSLEPGAEVINACKALKLSFASLT